MSERTNCGEVGLVNENCQNGLSIHRLNEKEPIGRCLHYYSQVGDPTLERTSIGL